ncbi:MAG: chromosomal replication initiator protein DnaA, partial [Clostridia bacterium]|nr:chromosomal replication initiator protein DnaA [Clostridia bacterium]
NNIIIVYITNLDLALADIMDRLSINISSAAYEIYFVPLRPLTSIENKLLLVVPRASQKNVLEKSYIPAIKKAMAECNSFFTDVSIILESEADKYYISVADNSALTAESSEDTSIPFIKSYTFDNFVIGDSNQMAAAAAAAVAETPGTIINPLFIHSRPGLGKTHILHAIGNSLRVNKPALKVLYTTAENFTNDYIYSIRHSKNADVMRNFNNKYRSQDVLMIDDVQFFEKGEKTQEALFHIFNDLYSANKQIILSSDRPVKNLAFLDERLSSRFASGIIADIQPPNFETRVAILEKKALSYKINISRDVIYYLAEKEQQNIRILEGMLKTVSLFSTLNQKPANSVDLAKEALRDSAITAGDNITINSITEVCCAYFNVKKEDITGKRRTKDIVEPRQFAMYVITMLLPNTPLATIGEYFGRDHTTVINARDKIGRLSNEDTRIKTIIGDLKNLVINK